MITDRDKLVRLADRLAKTKGLELVVREWQSENGPMMRLSFQQADSFEELADSVLVNFWRSTAAEGFKRVQDALAELPETPTARTSRLLREGRKEGEDV